MEDLSALTSILERTPGIRRATISPACVMVPRFNLGYGSSREHIGIIVTQTGVLESPKPSGLQAGDAIIVTNTLGDSITAIEVIKHKLYHSEEEKLRLIKQHIEVKPRVNEALAVWESGLATSVQLTIEA